MAVVSRGRPRGAPQRLEFEEFVAFIGRHPLRKLDHAFVRGVDGASENKMRSRFANDSAFGRIPTNEGSGDGYSEADYFGSLVRILHPYSVMRALAMVPANLDVEIAWDYGLQQADRAQDGYRRVCERVPYGLFEVL